MASKKSFTGADLKAFWNDRAFWNEGGQGKQGFYIEEDLYVVDGKELDTEAMFEAYGENHVGLPDDAKVQVSGFLRENDHTVRDEYDLATSFKKWVDGQSTQRLVAVFEIRKDLPATDLQKLTDTLASLGAQLSGFGAPADTKPAKKPKVG